MPEEILFMGTLLILCIIGREEMRMNQQRAMRVHMFSIYSQPNINQW